MNTRPKIGAVKAETTPKMLVGINPKRKRLYVQNLGANNVELLSSKDSKYGDGIRIASNGDYPIMDYCQGAYWIIAETETQDVRFEEDIEA